MQYRRRYGRGGPFGTWAGNGPAAREQLARARVLELFAGLGEPPLWPGAEGGLERLLDRFCEGRAVHGLWAEGWPAPVGHVVVAPRGAVVVVAGPGAGRLAGPVVREALVACRRLRRWLEASAWAGVPVLAAVCLLPGAALPRGGEAGPVEALPARVLGDVWVGLPGRLPAWLGSGAALSEEQCQRLRRLLYEELCWPVRPALAALRPEWDRRR